MVVGPIFDICSLTIDSSDMIQPLSEGISSQEKQLTAETYRDGFVQRNLLVSTN